MNQKTGAFAYKKRERCPTRFKMKLRPRMAWALGAVGSWSAAGRQLVGSWLAAGRQLQALGVKKPLGVS